MDWTKKRKEWRSARDDHGVKAGAVSGVKIGDAIDKVCKVEESGYASLLTAAKNLKASLLKYQAGLKKVKPKKDFSGWIAKNLMKDVDGFIADISADLKSLIVLQETIRKSPALNILFPDTGTVVGAADQAMKSDPSLSWLDAVKKGREYTIFVQATKELSVTSKAMQKIKLKRRMKKDYQQFLVDFGKDLQSDIVWCVKWFRSDNREEFVTTLKPAKGRDWTFHKQSELNKIFKFLMT